MDINWRSPLVTRVGILLATMVVFAFVFSSANRSYILILALLGAILFQVTKLMKELESSNENITSFLDSIRFDDLSQSFKTESDDPTIQNLHRELNEAIAKLRMSRKEKDSEYQFFKNIVQHVAIGLLTFKRDGSIQIMNTAAKRLLRITKADHIDDLKEVSETLVDTFLKLKTGGRELLQLKFGDETIQLSVFAIELTLRDEEVKLISMNNIQSELEEKEMEAWQNLVRVLTHEIMNSVTPISSLAGIVEEDLKSRIDEQTERPLTKVELEDMYLSLQTINRRSGGLIRFVKEFKNLTHIPKPKLAEIAVKELLEELAHLHKKELADHAITITLKINPENLYISADKTMIEQVLINLLKNAIQAFDEQSDREIWLTAYSNEKGRAVISVKDNGAGIDADALEKIFIPFFSTKKSGSGIGLSLSKQIMRQHEGSITVKSTLGEGTEFLLRF
ncbi:MAG: GHKL domain-containing protein [Cyclobacteriaceae bacterium]|jgi:two-component system nitrogen regulation sensor histidine kinase NtrY|nr:GHKL domain-containing protein [Cyclobacteriaceae bacterium]